MTRLHFIDARRIVDRAASIRAKLETASHASAAGVQIAQGDSPDRSELNAMLREILALRAELGQQYRRLELAIGKIKATLPPEEWERRGLCDDMPSVLRAARWALADTFRIADLLVTMGAVAPDVTAG